MKYQTYRKLEKFFLWVFKYSNHVLDISIEQPYDPENTGSVARFELNLRMPLFWLRRGCQHVKAKKTGIVRDGKTYCLRCERLVVMDGRS